MPLNHILESGALLVSIQVTLTSRILGRDIQPNKKPCEGHRNPEELSQPSEPHPGRQPMGAAENRGSASPFNSLSEREAFVTK